MNNDQDRQSPHQEFDDGTVQYNERDHNKIERVIRAKLRNLPRFLERQHEQIIGIIHLQKGSSTISGFGLVGAAESPETTKRQIIAVVNRSRTSLSFPPLTAVENQPGEELPGGANWSIKFSV